ncbi:MAG: 4-alpha-glucanotransferase, partial [Methylobacteriaceae bacterium]|nr:4-alpha-glucanotransferase [Methylobacteriaceae bacterium]
DRARDAGLWLGFYRDLAVGAAPDGAEVWATQDRLIAGASIGAPPDPFSAAGQIWALPPPDPLAMQGDGLAGFEALLAANMRHAGALRIDHVMGLARLFLVPDGAAASEGAYLAYPFEEALAVVALASRRAGCLVVGEDLGTVPEGFRDRLAAADVLSYRVLWFERDADGFAPPAAYPAKAMACASTHDLPTLAGWWSGQDIDERATLGLLTPEDAARERADRAADRRAFLAALRAAGALDVDLAPDGAFDMRLVDAASRFVAATPSLIAMAQIDDLAGEATAINLPGTDRERPNWRRRLSAPLAEALAPARLAALARPRLND